MKIIICLLLLVGLSTRLFAESTAYIKSYSNSGCLPEQSGQSNSYSVSSTDTEEITAVVNENREIIVTHMNVEYNCCVDSITVELVQEGNILKLIETEINPMCDCICPYDVTSTIAGLDAGIYTIQVWKDGGTILAGEIQVNTTCVLVKPNPYNPDKGNLTFFGDGIVFDKTEIKIYTFSGELVKILKNEFAWNGRNEDDEPVTSSIYIYTYKSPKEKGVGKFTVIKQ